MNELKEYELNEVNGGVAWFAAILFTETSITASGVASAIGIGGGVGALYALIDAAMD